MASIGREVALDAEHQGGRTYKVRPMDSNANHHHSHLDWAKFWTIGKTILVLAVLFALDQQGKKTAELQRSIDMIHRNKEITKVHAAEINEHAEELSEIKTELRGLKGEAPKVVRGK